MAGFDMTEYIRVLQEKLEPLDVERLKFILADSCTKDQLAELETSEDIALMFKKCDLLQDKLDWKTWKNCLQIIGRNDLSTKFDIYVAAESHVTTFEDYGYTFICDMVNEDRMALVESVASLSRDNEKQIAIQDIGAGKLGVKVFKVAQWKTRCQTYFNRYYKTSNIIVVPTDGDRIMNTLVSVCSESNGRGFVFKNYDIAKHLEFLGYSKRTLKERLGAVLTNKSIPYIAYLEQKNVIFICERVFNGSNIHKCLKNIALMVKLFLTLYHGKIQTSGVNIVGLLIRGKENQDLVKCKFCHLLSPSWKDFESRTSFEKWWIPIETYEGWWDLANPEIQSKLFGELAAEIICFMALQEKGLPKLTEDKSLQFKQTYFLYTPQQMDIHFSDAKHVLVQGSYGSGKSLIGLKKLEQISKTHGKIIYTNFDPKSNLHFYMEKNVKEYVEISSKKIKCVSDIRDILKSPGKSIYIHHNSAGKNLSAILQETISLNEGTSEKTKANYHVVVEEYDGEKLSNDEAEKITKLTKGGDFMESNIILLAQPLTAKRDWNIGGRSWHRETYMFHKLENTFKIVKLEEVLRCSNEICEITKFTQNFIQNKDSVFNTEFGMLALEQQQQTEGSKERLALPNLPKANYPEVGILITRKVSDETPYRGIDLDQAFESSAPLQKSIVVKSKISNKFSFLCQPTQGVDIKGLKPNLVEFSDYICSTSNIAVISLALVLRNFIGKNKATTVLHMADKEPQILRRTIQLMLRLDEKLSHTQNIEVYLKKSKQSKMIFSSNFQGVNGMEFDHVVIVVSRSGYYLKYYLPLVISRCTYNLTFVLLPKDNLDMEKGVLHDTAKETVADIMDKLKCESLVKQVVIVECKTCEKGCYCFPKKTENEQTFGVHTHSQQYKDYLLYLANYTESEEQVQSTSPRPDAEQIGMDNDTFTLNFTSGGPDEGATERFHDAACRGDLSLIMKMWDAGIDVDKNLIGDTALMFGALENKTEVVGFLLQKGADVNRISYATGCTALHYAAANNSTDAMKLLLEHGAPTKVKDFENRTPMDIAREKNHKEAVRLLLDFE